MFTCGPIDHVWNTLYVWPQSEIVVSGNTPGQFDQTTCETTCEDAAAADDDDDKDDVDDADDDRKDDKCWTLLSVAKEVFVNKSSF